ncbi:DNA repair ATPase [Streptomyces californicus]
MRCRRPSGQFLEQIHRAAGPDAYTEDLAALGDDLAARRQLVEGWLVPYAETSGAGLDGGDLAEAVAVELCPELERYAGDAPLTARLEGLLGDHPRIAGGGALGRVRLDELLARTAEFRTETVPGFRAYQRLRTSLVSAERGRLRLDDHRPRVMSAFVRNRLLDEVYLPLIGDSLAKQLGTADADRRTDSQGMLLLSLTSPATARQRLMEYIRTGSGWSSSRSAAPTWDTT